MSIHSAGSFSLTNGASASIENLAGSTITVPGNCAIEGTSGSYINMNTSTTYHYFNVTGSLRAKYVTLGYSDASGSASSGYAVPATDAGNNINWAFGTVWTNGNGTGLWSDDGNWSTGTKPASDEAALFRSTCTDNCQLDADVTIASITFTSGYTGVFDFTTHTLAVSDASDFRAGGDVRPSNGALTVGGTGTYTLIPPAADTLPAITKSGTGTVTVSTNALVSKGRLTVNAGTFHFGSSGLTHRVASFDVNGGTLNLGNSTVKTTGDVDFITGGTVTSTANAGVIDLDGAAPAVQVFSCRNALNAITVLHSGTGTIRLGNLQLWVYNFTQTAGIFDFNGLNVFCANNFTINNGRSTTFANLTGRTLRADGNMALNGTAGDSLNLNPASWWYVDVNGSLAATYAVLRYSNASASNSAGTATFSRDADFNVKWNFPAISQPTPVWSRTELGAVSGGAIGDAKLFVGTGSTLRAIKLSDGTDDWTYAPGYGACGAPSYAYTGGSYKVVCRMGTYVVCRQDASGSSSAVFAVNLGSRNPYPTPDGAYFYVVYNGRISKRSMTTGAEAWGANVSASTGADPVVYNDYVYFATTSGVIHRYSSSGTPVSSYNTGTAINLPLLIQNNTVYAAPATNRLYARKSDLTQKWSANYVTLAATNTAPLFSAYTYAIDTIVYAGAGTRVQKVKDNWTSGVVQWSYDAEATVQGGPIEFGSAVYFGRDNNRYYAVNKSTGTLIGDWPYRVANGNASAGPWIHVDGVNSRVIFGTDGGDVHAFTAE